MTTNKPTFQEVPFAPVDCPPLETAVVEFIQKFSIEQLTPERRELISRVLRDQFSSQIGNSRLPWSSQVLRMVAASHAPGSSTLITTDTKAAASDAAFVNATLAHGFEYDEGHRPSNSHPASCAVATAIAIGEEINASLDEVLTAILMGYEVYARIGTLAAPDLIQRGFHPAAVLATFGAAAVSAKLYKFDPETTLHALAIALSHASGATEYAATGGSVKRLHPGIGVRGGMTAARLAQAGITGPRAFLSGVKGFFKVFLRRDPAENAAERFSLGDGYEILRCGYKRYCCCGANHASIDILTEYASQQEQIETVSLRIPKLCNNMVGTVNPNTYSPSNIEQVQFSLPTQAAFALLGYGNGYQAHLNYLHGEIDMDSVGAVIKKVVIQEDHTLDAQYPGKFVTEATILFKDGRSESKFVQNSLGTPDNPMPESSHDAKFLELTSGVLGEERANALLEALHKLDPDMGIKKLTAMSVAA